MPPVKRPAGPNPDGRKSLRSNRPGDIPGLSVLAPIWDSLGDVVGVVEVYAPLVPERRPGEMFGVRSIDSVLERPSVRSLCALGG